jgi:hypothetical protein
VYAGLRRSGTSRSSFSFERSCYRASLHALQNVPRIVDDVEPMIIGAVGEGVFFRAGVGKHEVVVAPIVGDAPTLRDPILDVESQDRIRLRGRLRLRRLLLQ